MSDYNPTDDELRMMAEQAPEPWRAKLARLVLREREATEKMRSEAWDAVHAWETAAIEWRQRAEKAEAQRDELAEKLRADTPEAIQAKITQIAAESPAVLGRHSFLQFPTGRPGCFRALNLDGRPPRCEKPFGDPIHQAAAGEPATPDWWCGICSPNFLDNDGGCDDCHRIRADHEDDDPIHETTAGSPAAHVFVHTHKRDHCGHQPDPRGPWCGRPESEHAAGSATTPPEATT